MFTKSVLWVAALALASLVLSQEFEKVGNQRLWLRNAGNFSLNATVDDQGRPYWAFGVQGSSSVRYVLRLEALGEALIKEPRGFERGIDKVPEEARLNLSSVNWTAAASDQNPSGALLGNSSNPNFPFAGFYFAFGSAPRPGFNNSFYLSNFTVPQENASVVLQYRLYIQVNNLTVQGIEPVLEPSVPLIKVGNALVQAWNVSTSNATQIARIAASINKWANQTVLPEDPAQYAQPKVYLTVPDNAADGTFFVTYNNLAKNETLLHVPGLRVELNVPTINLEGEPLFVRA
jgi:hypothetical protein